MGVSANAREPNACIKDFRLRMTYSVSEYQPSNGPKIYDVLSKKKNRLGR